MSISMRQPGVPIARLAPTPRSGTDGGYPWHDGELLYADDLNAAVTAVNASVLDFGAKGDGVTDDTAAIQNVLNTFAGGKGTVYVPDTGEPYMCNILNIPTGTDLLLHGTIMQRPNQATALINIVNCNTVTIRGNGVIDGNKNNQHIDGACCIASVNAHNIQIEGITVQNAWDWNMNITSSTNVKIDRVRLLNCRASNEFAAGCDNCWITNSTIDGVDVDGGWTFYGNVSNSGISNCIVRNAFAGGIGIYSDAAQPGACNNIVISDNLVYNNFTGGIAFGTDGRADIHTGITVTGNRCFANNNIGNHLYADIWCSYGKGVTITGNDLSGSGSGNNPTYGVFVGVNAQGVNITGNIIWNEGQGGTAGAGVYVQAANNVLISSNIFFDDQATPTMANAIAGNAGAGVMIIGNRFGRLGGTAITMVPSVDTVIDTSVPAVPLAGDSTVTGHIEIISPDAAAALHIEASGAGILCNSHGISYNNGNAIAFQDAGATISVQVDGIAFGNILTVGYLSGTPVTIWSIRYGLMPTNAANDAAAAAAGIAVGGTYRNGSVLMVRVT